MTGVLEQIAAQRVIPVLRSADVADAVATARACAAAGMRAIELTRTTPDVERALEALRDDGLLLGLGTVTDRDQVAAAARAGARFVVSFTAPAGMVEAAHEHGLAAIPGAFTPTEVAACAAAGADAVKLFPARAASPAYLGDLRAVLPGRPRAGHRRAAGDGGQRGGVARGRRARRRRRERAGHRPRSMARRRSKRRARGGAGGARRDAGSVVCCQLNG